MDIQSYHKLLDNPALLNDHTLAELEKLVSAFPYAENIRTLYTLNLLLLNDFNYQKSLNTAAFHASNRKRLKYWIDFVQGVNFYEKDIPIDAVLDTELSEQDELEVETSPISDVSIEADSVESNDEVVVEEKSTAQFPEKLVQQEDVLPEDPIEKMRQKKTVRNKTELLLLVKKRLAEIEAEKYTQASLNKGEGKEIGPSNTAIIDQFIKTQPSISRPNKKEFFNPQRGAISSTVDDDDFFVTETLAQIYADQDKYEKAIEIYRKLILKFPKKSSYFASRIQDLSKK